MSWSDTAEIQNQLDAALDKYQWAAAADVCDRLIARIYQEETPYPEGAAKDALASLRRKRQFAMAVRVAEVLIRTGQTAARVRRQYAQALIDQGILLAPEPLLRTLAMEPLDGDSQVAEAHGLLGRIYKQLYVNADRPGSPYARLFFERALSEYLQTYQLAPKRYSWHGINVVALLHRAAGDGLDVAQAPNADDLASAILASLPEPSKVVEVFDLATRLEALIALGRHADAEKAALDYVAHAGADVFEIGSTLRQLEQVWRLKPDTSPGSTVLPLLRAARLRKEGGGLETSPTEVDKEIRAVRRAVENLENRQDIQLEKVFGEDATVTLQWYETGLQRTKSVARVEKLNGKGHGTGWLVKAADFFPPESLEGLPPVLLLTNAHVVNEQGTGGALSPDEARANFQGLKQRLEFERVVWSSPLDQLDATFLAFKDNQQPSAEAIPLQSKPVQFTEPPSRTYIIGHPGGRDLELSLQDNLLLGCKEPRLHYRTPTEGGSSGSPVFEALDWRAIALHHAGGRFERLDGKQPPYEANEGITVLAIREAIKQQVAGAVSAADRS
jgi:hypothetical protein